MKKSKLLKGVNLIYNHKIYLDRYGQALSNPFKTIYINPNEVNFLMAPRFQCDLPRAGSYILNGDWDTKVLDRNIYISTNRNQKVEKLPDKHQVLNFNNYMVYKTLKSHFNDKVPWEKTVLYQWLLQKLENAENMPWRLRSVEEIYSRFGYLDYLYDKIKTEGYCTKNIFNIDNNKIRTYFKNLIRHKTYNDDSVLVNIGRDGRILLDDGRHRFMIAKILGLKRIPVRVLVRHEEWQRIRTEIVNGNIGDFRPIKEHPDLQDVIKL